MNKLFVVFAFITASGAFAQSAAPLSGEEIKAAMAASPKWFGDAGASYGGQKNIRFEFRTNGYVFGVLGGGMDSGPWAVRGDQLCFTLRKWVVKEICSPVTKNADGSYSLAEIFDGRKE